MKAFILERRMLFGGFIVIVALVGFATYVSASHGTTSDPMLYGFVMDAGMPVSGAYVKNCWDSTAYLNPSTCFPAQSGYTDSAGHWWHPFPATGYYVLWAEKGSLKSQYEYKYFDFAANAQVQVPNLIIAGANSGGSGSQPDLAVEGFGYSWPIGSSPTAGQSIGFFTNVKNLGTVSAAASSTRVRLDVGNNGTWDVLPANMGVAALAAASTQSVSWPNAWTAVAGTHLLEFCADDGNAVLENNEANNCGTMTLTVSQTLNGTHTLTVTKNGTGNIVSSPAGINCGLSGGLCSTSFASGTTVTLTAQNDTATGSVFSSWSGDCAGSSFTCSVLMDINRSVTANFSGGTTTTGVDFQIGSFGYSYPGGGPKAGDKITFYGEIWNKGSIGAPVSTTQFRLDTQNDGSWDFTPAPISTPALNANVMKLESWFDVWTAVSGTHRFEICADATNAATESNEANNCTAMTFTVFASDGAQLYGFVKDGSGGAVAGADVKYLWSADGNFTQTSPAFAAYSDATGRWSLSSPQAGSYRFWAYKNGVKSAEVNSTYATSESAKQVADLVLATGTIATGYISGYAYNSALGQPAAGAMIEIRKEDGTIVRSVTTGTNGSYYVDGLAINVAVKISAFPPAGSNLVPPSPFSSMLTAEKPNAHLDFYFSTVSGNGTITGRVLGDGGVGVAGVWINGRVPNGAYASTQTTADGSYKFSSIAAGSWEIFAYADPSTGYAYAEPFSRRVDIVAGASVSGVDFTLKKADATISGRLVDEKGMLVTTINAGVYVEGKSLGAPVMNGTFTLRVPAGTYTINAWLPPESGYVSRGAMTVTVASGGTVSVDLGVLSQAGGGKITGKIVDGSGATVTNVFVDVAANQKDQWVPGTVNTSDGTFTILVPSGTWQLGFRVLDTRFVSGGPVGDPISITAGQTVTRNITLLRSDTTIVVQVKKTDGSSFANVGVEVSSLPFSPEFTQSMSGVFRTFMMTDSSGYARFAVPAGTYYIHAFAPPEIAGGINPPEVSVTVASGETKPVTISFRSPNATISGRVLFNGNPVPGAFVGAWSKSGGFVMAQSGADGAFRLTVSSADAWFVKAGANVNGVFAESDAVTVDMANRTAATQDITLKSTTFVIPPPITATHTVTQPYAARLEDGTKVACAANCFGTSGTANITVEPDVHTPDQGSLQVIGVAYNIEARKSDGALISALGSDAVVTIPYDEEALRTAGADEGSLQIAFFDDATGSWKPVETSIVDATNNTVTCTTSHLTRFALVTSSYASVVSPTINEGDLIRGPDGVKVYIVNARGFKRHIFNPAVFGMYKHFTWESIKDVSQATLDSYATSDLYRADGDPKVYSLVETDEARGLATKRWLDMSPDRFAQLGYNWNQVFIVNAQERDYYATGSAIQ